MAGEDKNRIIQQTRIVEGRKLHLVELGVEGTIDGGYLAKGWNFTVDLERSPTLKSLLARLESEVRQHPGDEVYALKLVYEAVDRAFPVRNVRTVNAFDVRLKQSGKTVSLEDFAKAGIGDCAQTAVASALLIEKLHEQGLLPGVPSIEEKLVETEFYSESHIWCSYRSPRLQQVLDVVREFKGDAGEYQKVLEDLEQEIHFSH